MGNEGQGQTVRAVALETATSRARPPPPPPVFSGQTGRTDARLCLCLPARDGPDLPGPEKGPPVPPRVGTSLGGAGGGDSHKGGGVLMTAWRVRKGLRRLGLGNGPIHQRPIELSELAKTAPPPRPPTHHARVHALALR